MKVPTIDFVATLGHVAVVQDAGGNKIMIHKLSADL